MERETYCFSSCFDNVAVVVRVYVQNFDTAFKDFENGRQQQRGHKFAGFQHIFWREKLHASSTIHSTVGFRQRHHSTHILNVSIFITFVDIFIVSIYFDRFKKHRGNLLGQGLMELTVTSKCISSHWIFDAQT
jgi:hypothetical protein